MKVTFAGLTVLCFLYGLLGQGLCADPTIAGSVAIEGARGVFLSGGQAFVACQDGVKIVDIGNPQAPAVVMEVDDIDVEDLYVGEKYAYTVSIFEKRMYVADIENPQAPSVVAAVDFEQEPQSVYISGSYAYVVTAFRVGNGLFVFDVSNPRNPVQVGSMICDFPQPLSCSTPVDIHVSGSYAYLADSGIVVVDITDPTKPVVVGEVKKDGTNNPGADYLWATGVFVSGSVAYVTELDVLRVLDIRDFDNPVLLGSVTIPCTWGGNAEQVQVSGSYAYVTNYDGLFVVDVSMVSLPPEKEATPSVGVSINQSQFEAGDRMTVSLTTTAGTGDNQWNAYLGLVFPDGALYFMTYDPLLSFVANWVPACPPGQITDQTVTILDFTLPPGLPSGNWVWASILAKPDLSEYSELSWVPFVIH
jgi:hypothetical protein